MLGDVLFFLDLFGWIIKGWDGWAGTVGNGGGLEKKKSCIEHVL